MLGYRRIVHTDVTYAASKVVVQAPLSLSSRSRRMGIISCHGSTLYGEDLFTKDNLVTLNDGLVRSTGLVLFVPDLNYLHTLTRADAGCGTTNGGYQVTDTHCVASDRGKQISGAGIPANTTILGVTPGSRLFLSNAATATAASVSLTIGPDPVESSSWCNASATAQLLGLFGSGGLLDFYGCRTDRAILTGSSQGGTVATMFGTQYPEHVGGLILWASSLDLETARGGGTSGVNDAWGQAAGSVGQVDKDGTATGHPTTIDPVTGLVTPARYYGTSLKYPGSSPLSGQFATPLDPRQMDIVKTSIVGAGIPVHMYESTYDTIAGPNVTSSIPDPNDPTHTAFLTGSGRIWSRYVGADVYTFSTVDDHPGNSTGDPIHDGNNQARDLPLPRIAAQILAVA